MNFLSKEHSFKLVLKNQNDKNLLVTKKVLKENSNNTPQDKNKRMFLKLAGLTGLGFVASQVLPKKAKAYVLGNTPTSNVVGVKNSSNTRIDPATETTLGTRASETTLQAIKTNSDKFLFDGDGKLLTVSTGGSSASSVTLKDKTETIINPTTEESLVLLRRLLRQVDSLAVVDLAQRQRVVVDGAVISSGTITTVSTVTSATNVVALGGVDVRYLYTDTARNMYANGIRNNLLYT